MKIDLERSVGINPSKLEMDMRNSSKKWLKSLEESGWHLAEELWKKFSPSGQILRFFGDTVVIPVSGQVKEKAESIQEVLYKEIGDLMSDKLKKEYFHITIHDLNNEFEDLSRDELMKKIAETQRKCESIFKNLADYLKKNPSVSKIEMVSIGVIGGFVAISIGFVPKNEKDFNILMNLHSLFDELVLSKKPFHPHLTLGYYKAVNFSRRYIKRIKNTVLKLDKMSKGLEISLDIWETSYQIFQDMNNYNTILKLSNFRNKL